MKTEFSTLDIVKALGIQRERLREWMVRGFIAPSFPSPGQGQAAQFTIEDIYKIQAFRTMVEGGISRKYAATWAFLFGMVYKEWRSNPSNFLIDMDTVIFARNKERKPVVLLPSVILVSEDHLDRKSGGGRIPDPPHYSILDLKSGRAGMIVDVRGIEKMREETKGHMGEGWTDIYILNFKAIREHVDSLFSKL